MDHERMAAELAGALRALLAVERAKTYGKPWNDSWIHARAVLARYEAKGPDLTTELLIACRRLLYWATPEETRALPAPWLAAIGDLRRTVDGVERSILEVVPVGSAGPSRRR
jgi:hypothetical protein